MSLPLSAVPFLLNASRQNENDLCLRLNLTL